MAHRPYPNVDRALNRLRRHYPSVPVIPMSPAMQSAAEGFLRIRAGLQEAASRAGTYVLSMRCNIEGGHLVTLSPGAAPAQVADHFSADFIEQVNQAPHPAAVSGPS
jgi:hypothetical protein